MIKCLHNPKAICEIQLALARVPVPKNKRIEVFAMRLYEAREAVVARWEKRPPRLWSERPPDKRQFWVSCARARIARAGAHV